MKIQLLSDLHFEFHPDQGAAFIESLDPWGVDILVLAGDIATPATLSAPMKMLAEKYRQILYVRGNHDFYGANREASNEVVAALSKKHKNLHHLDSNLIEIEGQRFLGAPLWFRKAPREWCREWSDFIHIDRLEDWVFAENEKAQKFFRKHIEEGDVVITHFLPSYECVSPRFKNELSNCFFVCPMDDVIIRQKPKLWMHGHTHDRQDLMIGETRILCNPYGYAGGVLNKEFEIDLRVEV